MRPLLPLLLAACTFAAPTAPKKKPEPAKPLTSAQKAEYAKVIQPIFDAHCVSCHGPKKEKGKLRLDTLEATLKGGKNPTFVIGKPNSSMLLARVFLDRTAGDVMPPKAEKPLTEKQKEAIYAFIEGQPIPDELAKAAVADTKAKK
ncbi:MAG: c-type cytochrome domain-containing protein [Verrucomicrobiota bacterium]